LRDIFYFDRFKKEERKIEVFYLYGATGLGKTHFVHKLHGFTDVCTITDYRDNGRKMYFDAYDDGQDILVFDEFTGQAPISSMLRWLDKYPVKLPARYHDRTACFTKVYILSNLPLAKIYVQEQQHYPEIWNAFLRRIGRVYNFISLGEYIELSKETYYV
jgi:hypothetical protein